MGAILLVVVVVCTIDPWSTISSPSMYLLFWVLDIWDDGGDIGQLPDDRMLLRKREAKRG